MPEIKDKILLGQVVKGDRRGRQLGFPTANLDPSHTVVISGALLSAVAFGKEENTHCESGLQTGKLLKDAIRRTLTQENLSLADPLSSDKVFLFVHALLREIFAADGPSAFQKEELTDQFLAEEILNYFKGKSVVLAKEAPASGIPELSVMSDGVYAAVAGGVSAEILPAAVSVGTREQFYDRGIRITEAHLIGVELDLYDRLLCLHVKYFIRAQRKFSSMIELISAIENDVEESKRLLSM